MRLKRKTGILFSNGSDAMWWTEHNCMKCWKGQLARSDLPRLHSACSICSDIFIQWISGSEHHPTERAFDAVKQSMCPFFQKTRPKRKTRRPIKNQLTIPFEI